MAGNAVGEDVIADAQFMMHQRAYALIKALVTAAQQQQMLVPGQFFALACRKGLPCGQSITTCVVSSASSSIASKIGSGLSTIPGPPP